MNELYISYLELYKQSPFFARKKLVEAYLKIRNISEVARIFHTTRKTVRKALQRWEREGEEGLKDRSRRPHNCPRRTPLHIEIIIVSERIKTGYGRDRIARILCEKGLEVKPSTVRYVLRRYKLQGKYKRCKWKKKKRYYDFDSLYPLQHFETDLKEIFDKGTLSEKVIERAKKRNIPPYQWTAIDVKTRMRFLAYSYEKTFINGLIFMIFIIIFLRAMGIRGKITFQTDNGEEFGGKSPSKLDWLNKYIFNPLGAELIHIPKGKKEWNAYVERSHQTDDNEFYIPQLELCESVEEFLWRALRWEFMYNTRRYHSTIRSTPYEKLRKEMVVGKYIAMFPVFILDKISTMYELFFHNPSSKGGEDVLTKDLELERLISTLPQNPLKLL